MKWLAGILFTFCCVVPAYAQVVSVEGFCDQIHAYQKPAGVDFLSGRDDVVPAELNSFNASAYDVINIPIDVILAQRFQELNVPDGLNLLPTVSNIAVHQDGRIVYNGQDISEQLYALCGEQVASPDIDLKSDGKAHGQAGNDVLKSEPMKTKTVTDIKAADAAPEEPAEDILEGQYP